MKKKCDCDNPKCELPIGRCFICGNPSEKANRSAPIFIARDGSRIVSEVHDDRVEFTIGSCCFPRVLTLYEREWNALNRKSEPGWAPFNVATDQDGREFAEIQRDDSSGLFESDQAAAWHVAISLGAEPTYPDGA